METVSGIDFCNRLNFQVPLVTEFNFALPINYAGYMTKKLISLFCHISQFSTLLPRPTSCLSNPHMAKTMQAQNRFTVLKMPFLKGSNLCPVTAIKAVLSFTPGSDNGPLFSVVYGHLSELEKKLNQCCKDCNQKNWL